MSRLSGLVYSLSPSLSLSIIHACIADASAYFNHTARAHRSMWWVNKFSLIYFLNFIDFDRFASGCHHTCVGSIKNHLWPKAKTALVPIRTRGNPSIHQSSCKQTSPFCVSQIKNLLNLKLWRSISHKYYYMQKSFLNFGRTINIKNLYKSFKG